MKTLAIALLSIATFNASYAGTKNVCTGVHCHGLRPEPTCSTESWRVCREKPFFASCPAPVLNGKTVPGDCRPVAPGALACTCVEIW